MNVQRRDFLLCVTLVAAAAMPAWGQVIAVGPPGNGTPGTATPGAAPIPDFSGIWAHFGWPDVEPPLAGPGPVTSRSLRDGASDNYQLVGDYTNPILKPEAADVVKKHGEISLTGVPYPTPSNHCWPGGVPFVFWNIGMQMVQQPHQVTILYSNDHEVRRVRLNEPHPAQVTPSWYGDSIGHYEGDTLVIDTVGVKAGPFAMVDMCGTPFSPALHVVERYRLLDYEDANATEQRRGRNNRRGGLSSDPGLGRDPNYKGKGLQLEFTVDDQGVFTVPWSAGITYWRALSVLGEWPEYVCAENPYGYFPGRRAAVPIADKPDF
jgi:hypothetical protein